MTRLTWIPSATLGHARCRPIPSRPDVFLDRDKARHHQQVPGRPYSLWLAGGHPCGCAKSLGCWRTLTEARAFLATLEATP